MQTIINKFVSITWLTSDLYVSTVLHAIVFRTLPRKASPSLIFPLLVSEHNSNSATSYALRQIKALLWMDKKPQQMDLLHK